MKLNKVGKISQQIVDLVPLAEAGVTGAIGLITDLIKALHSTDLTTDIDAANAEGHRQVDALVARAAEAQAFLDSQK